MKLFTLIGALSSICIANTIEASTFVDHEEIAQNRKRKFDTQTHSTFQTISNHSEVLCDAITAINQYGAQNIWVVYDIDDCITFPNHAACLPCSYANEHKSLFQDLITGLSVIETSIVWNLKYRLSPSLLTESLLPKYLNTFKSLNINTLGITATMAGAVLNEEDCQHEHRFDILRSLGIEFNAPQEHIVLDEFPLFHRSYPIYHYGVGFNQASGDYGSTTKGEFFLALMNRLQQQPKAVFFVDDSSTNLKRFGQIMKEHSIDCFLYQYKSDVVHETRTIPEEDYIEFISDLKTKANQAV